ncbi:MAG: hypothetical protein IJK89_12615 [Clostridia bacterium]|nr:hypothetical protein [Clostridia bacterium]
MKHITNALKKRIAIVMVFIAMFAVIPSPMTLAADPSGNTPIVYIKGYQELIKLDGNGGSTHLLDDDGDIVDNAISQAAPLFAKALVTDDWDEYCDVTYEALKPLYADAQPSPDGTVDPNTGVGNYFENDLWSWSPEEIDPALNEQPYAFYEYNFDFRLSMLKNAEDLHAFVKAVEEKTGHDKVIMVGRCGSTNLIAAYLYQYQEPVNYADLEKLILISSNVDGVDFMEALLGGTVKINPEATYRLVKYQGYLDDAIADEGIVAFLNATIDMLADTGLGLKAICKLAQHIYEKVKDRLIARLMKEYYGICPGYITFVNENYEAYRSYIFQEEGDMEKYAAIIADADEYHYHAQVGFDERLQTMRDMGIEVDLVALYGDQTYPLMESADLTSDRIASVEDQSLGGRAAPLTGTFSAAYIAAREAEGKGAYLSPDRQIDASTGLFPDTTWYIKNSKHTFGDPLQGLVNVLTRTKNVTVNSDPAYPQFLNHFDTGLVPAQEKNENDMDWAAVEQERNEWPLRMPQSFFQMLKSLLRMLVDYLKTQLAPFRAKVSE